MELFEKIINSNYLVFIPIIIGLTALLYAIKNQRRSKKLQKFKQINCKGRSYTVISDENEVFNKLSVLYDRQELKNFTSTKLEITNTGTEVIRKNDISTKSPIKFSTINDDITVLAFEVIEPTKEINNVSVKIDDSGINLNFEFLEPQDKIFIEILHTGKGTTDLIGSGKIIGIKQEFSINPFEERIQQVLGKPEFIIKGITIIVFLFPVLLLTIITLIIFLITDSINVRLGGVIVTSILFLLIFRKLTRVGKKIDGMGLSSMVESLASDKYLYNKG